MNIDRFIRGYGPTWRQGVVTEHLGSLPFDQVRTLASGTPVVVDDHGNAWPVLCSELVEISTEDGIITGRCGERVQGDALTCVGHAYLLEPDEPNHYRETA